MQSKHVKPERLSSNGCVNCKQSKRLSAVELRKKKPKRKSKKKRPSKPPLKLRHGVNAKKQPQRKLKLNASAKKKKHVRLKKNANVVSKRRANGLSGNAN